MKKLYYPEFLIMCELVAFGHGHETAEEAWEEGINHFNKYIDGDGIEVLPEQLTFRKFNKTVICKYKK